MEWGNTFKITWNPSIYIFTRVRTFCIFFSFKKKTHLVANRGWPPPPPCLRICPQLLTFNMPSLLFGGWYTHWCYERCTVYTSITYKNIIIFMYFCQNQKTISLTYISTQIIHIYMYVCTVYTIVNSYINAYIYQMPKNYKYLDEGENLSL